MNATLGIALIAAVPACMLFYASFLLFSRARTAGFLLQVLGAGSLVIVVLCHLCEGLGLFPWMGWGFDHSIGHYLDLSSAILALMLFPAGYLLGALKPNL
jgi:hypothetical protein